MLCLQTIFEKSPKISRNIPKHKLTLTCPSRTNYTFLYHRQHQMATKQNQPSNYQWSRRQQEDDRVVIKWPRHNRYQPVSTKKQTFSFWTEYFYDDGGGDDDDDKVIWWLYCHHLVEYASYQWSKKKSKKKRQQIMMSEVDCRTVISFYFPKKHRLWKSWSNFAWPHISLAVCLITVNFSFETCCW